jgi:3-oxoacyl-[acyl-carrier-protein] synthase II
MSATEEALAQSGLTIAEENAPRVGVIIGSALGGITTLMEGQQTLTERGPGRISPFLLTMTLSDMASGHISIKLGAKAVNYNIVSACASGADSIGEAANIIRRGGADAMIAGASEAPLVPIILGGFAAARAVSRRNDEPATASSPFDARRDGFVIGEGAASLVLEAEEHARERGATILAELAGYGATSDAFHVTQPDEHGEGAARAMRLALGEAGMEPDEVSYLNAHGTSTPLNDKFETLAIKHVFGDYAWELPISSTKSMTGHLLGSAGAVEAGFAVLALRDAVIPPTINYAEPDPDCDLDYVPNTARHVGLQAVMSNSLGFGGHNASLVFRRYQP